MFNFKYEIKNKPFFKRKDLFKEMPIIKGNQDENINWIDDITYMDLINGNVDCIGKIDEIYIALAVCHKDCGHFQLIVDGSPQVCPKYGRQMFRIKTKKYKLIN